MTRLIATSGVVVGMVAFSMFGCYIYMDTLSNFECLLPNRFKQHFAYHQQVFPDHLKSGWTPPELPDHLQDADQKDPELIQHIREHWIIRPFMGSRNLSLEEKNIKDFSQHGVPIVIDRILNGRRGGFIVECGAADGLITSNSLWLELYRNWTGILIEANPSYFSRLLELKRHMYMLNACLSPTTKPELLSFSPSGISGGISNYLMRNQNIHNTSRMKRQSKGNTVQCFPYYSVLAALGVTHVDFFSLDVEGAEIPILKTLPFDDITIDSFSIETRVLPAGNIQATERKTVEVTNILSKHGFQVAGHNPLDVILVHKDLNSSSIQ